MLLGLARPSGLAIEAFAEDVHSYREYFRPVVVKFFGGRMNNGVRYKQFDITIRANLDGSPGRFDIVWQIRRVEDKTNLVHTRLVSKEFVSEEVAYECGLQAARSGSISTRSSAIGVR